MLYRIGTPVGILDNSGDRYFYAGGSLLRMKNTAHRIWMRFTQGNTAEMVFEAMRQTGISPDEILETIENLQSIGLLTDERNLLLHKPLRFGHGIGRLPNSDQCAVFIGSQINVSYVAYLLWCYCDGLSTLEDISNKIVAEIGITLDHKQLLMCVNELIKCDLIVFYEVREH